MSALVATGQLARDAALRMCDGVAYPDQVSLQDDRDYFLKKMRWTPGQLDDYLARAPRAHADFPSEKGLWDRLERVYRAAGRSS